jgi:hypothetical protein
VQRLPKLPSRLLVPTTTDTPPSDSVPVESDVVPTASKVPKDDREKEMVDYEPSPERANASMVYVS